MVGELRSTINKLEQNLRNLKESSSQRDLQLSKKIEYLKAKADSATANYTTLKRRRDYEIEGFTADILNLRAQLKSLERSILKYDQLEDRELYLMETARATGEKVSKISRNLQFLKSKVYDSENTIQSLRI